jgi:signal transduction histidine kinase
VVIGDPAEAARVVPSFDPPPTRYATVESYLEAGRAPEDIVVLCPSARPDAAIASLATDAADRLESFLAAVSGIRHDLSNPLTAAMTEVELLLLDVQDPEVRVGAESILRELRRIREVAERLSDL